MELKYVKVDGYLLPNINLGKQYNVGKYGLLRLNYIKNYNKRLYFELLMNENLNQYLHEFDLDLIKKTNNLIKKFCENENINEELKIKNQLLWIGKMNNINNRIEEILLKEYVYV